MQTRRRRLGTTAEAWNAKNPVGTLVNYYTGLEVVPTKTRSEAWELGHGEAVVLIEGKSGGVALWALTPRNAPHEHS